MPKRRMNRCGKCWILIACVFQNTFYFRTIKNRNSTLIWTRLEKWRKWIFSCVRRVRADVTRVNDKRRPCLMIVEAPPLYHKGPLPRMLSFPRFQVTTNRAGKALSTSSDRSFREYGKFLLTRLAIRFRKNVSLISLCSSSFTRARARFIARRTVSLK